MKVELKVDDAQAHALLQRLERAGTDLRPALLHIGDTLTASTKQRFQDSRAPDGTPWARNTAATLLASISAYKSSFGKTGRLTSKGAGRIAGKKPLIGETRSLSTTINSRLAGANAVEIGSPMEYAAVQQFGAKKGQFGKTKRGAPIPWGDIPARPFLGVSADDLAEIRAILAEHLDTD